MKIILLVLVVSISCKQPGNKKGARLASDTFDSIQVENLKRQDSVSEYNITKEEIMVLAKPAYTKAYVEVNEMLQYISLVERGELNTQDVINKYNSSLGKIMGQYKTIKEIKKRLEDGGDAYIQMMWNKEAARIATEKAANADFETKQNH